MTTLYDYINNNLANYPVSKPAWCNLSVGFKVFKTTKISISTKTYFCCILHFAFSLTISHLWHTTGSRRPPHIYPSIYYKEPDISYIHVTIHVTCHNIYSMWLWLSIPKTQHCVALRDIKEESQNWDTKNTLSWNASYKTILPVLFNSLTCCWIILVAFAFH